MLAITTADHPASTTHKAQVSSAAPAALGTAGQPDKKPMRGTVAQPLEVATMPDALLRVATVAAITGLSASSIFRKTAAGEFPTPVRMGARCTRWPAGAVRAWLAAQCATAG